MDFRFLARARGRTAAFLFSAFIGAGGASPPALAASVEVAPVARQLVAGTVDDSRKVTLNGNVRSEANAQNDRGLAEGTLFLEHMQLLLKRPAEREQALEQFMLEQQRVGSPSYHKWLTAAQFGALYGPAQSDIEQATAWLQRSGFQVNQVNAGKTLIDFSGTAENVRESFGTEIHRLEVGGVSHIANMSNPKIPAALAPLVAGVVSLNDFRPHTNFKPHPQYTYAGTNGTLHALVPADLATIYNLNPLFNANIKGQGQTIVLIEDTNVYSTADVSTFRSTFGLGTGTFTQVHPGGCTNPGDVSGNDGEATLDVEWAAAAAPAATLELASCADTSTTFGGLIAIQNLINGSSPPAIMSVSYGECEAENGATANAAYVSTYQQAASEGVSVFVSSGDEGAASCDANATSATHGIAVSGFASTPYNVAVGGTDYSDTYAGTTATYWNSTNTSTYGSAKSYIPEIPWNDSCASQLIATYNGSSTTYGSGGFCNSSTGTANYLTTGSGSGGPSTCATGTASTTGVTSGSCAGTAKPSWQSGFLGNPADGVRDIPDVSLFAANGVWGHYFVYCYSGSSTYGGAPCTGAPSGWSGAGGTSFSAPIMAAIQSLVNQKIGSSVGNPNPTYYQLAKTEYGASGSSSCNSSNGASVGSSCLFYDVTQGDMDVNCTGTHNCYKPSGTNGVLSTSNSAYSPAYGTGTGWDFATGIGSVNAANLVNNWPVSGGTADYTLAASPTSVSEAQGASATSTITITPTGGFSGSVALSASGLPSGVTAAFSPASATSTSTLTLTASGTATTGTSTVTITGTSGSLSHTSTLSLTVTAASQSQADFSLSTSPSSVSEKQGASATSTVTVTASNGFSGSVALSASGLPSGVTAAFSPASATTTSTLTLTAGSTATTGTSTVTITGTSGSLSHTASVSLTVTAGGGTSTQLLGNTGFESGTSSAPWTASSGVINNSTSEPPHAGSWDAWLDGYGSAHTDTLSQAFTIPSGKTSASLAFYLHIDTAETTTSSAYDTLKVQILDSSGTVLGTLATYSNLNAASGYVLRTFSLNSYIGKSVTLKFTGTEDSSLQTSFVIDDVTVTVQ